MASSIPLTTLLVSGFVVGNMEPPNRHDYLLVSLAASVYSVFTCVFNVVQTLAGQQLFSGELLRHLWRIFFMFAIDGINKPLKIQSDPTSDCLRRFLRWGFPLFLRVSFQGKAPFVPTHPPVLVVPELAEEKARGTAKTVIAEELTKLPRLGCAGFLAAVDFELKNPCHCLTTSISTSALGVSA